MEQTIKIKVDSAELDVLSQEVMKLRADLADCVELVRVLTESVKSASVSIEDLSRVDDRPKDMSVYCGDDYPRAGCTLVVCFKNKGWSLVEYAPGFSPIGSAGLIASYASRPLGSLGIALDAYAAGKTIKSVLPEMVKAERDYAEASGSTVTL